MKKYYIPFTKEMKKDYTILVPNMLPMHFNLISQVFKNYGYNMELLETSGPEIAETGLKYVHNDTCYPALLVIGQFINAIQSGKYDPHKTALILFQTGGGCRASNYISLLRKALARAGYEYVPVISFSVSGIEQHSGFKLNLKIWLNLFHALIYGDLLMALSNQCKPYELNQGDTKMLCDELTARLADEITEKRASFRRMRENCRYIIECFSKIPIKKSRKIKVGIVGEIYVKFSPLGNNDLEQFLIDEGAEVVIPGLWDFCLYTVYNILEDRRLYGIGKAKYPVFKVAYKLLNSKKKELNEMMTERGFAPMSDFETAVEHVKDYVNTGAKMGEGWLLPAEMLELHESGVSNVVCTQPFGCLPNHIFGKGMIKPLREKNPGINIIAIDYDPGASRVNQENRIKLMLANAKEEISSTYPESENTAKERVKEDAFAI